MLRSLPAYLFCLFFFGASAQSQVITDTSHIKPRSFSADRINAYKADKTFQYVEETQGPKSDWTRFWDWIMEKLRHLLGIGTSGIGYFKIVIAVGILLIFVFIMWRLNRGALLARRNTEGAMAYKVGQEDIQGIGFDQEIQKAIQSKNFRMAVRLLYLQALKNLADRGLIVWRANKTNAAYLNEIIDQGQRQSFADLTHQFENNWYGAIPIGEREFTAVADRFESFKMELIQL
jgi:hypothetical protein